MAATIKDVAVYAGVSTATVSHVLNGTRYVAESTQERVKMAIKKLGYVPNISASGLRSNRTKRIGMLVPSISSFFSVDIADAVEQVLGKNGYQLVIACSHEDIEREKKQMDVFTYQQVDGVLMFPAPGAHGYLDEMVRKIPIVFLDRKASGCERDVIIGENISASYDLVMQMLEEGRRRIGILNGTEGVSALEERIEGYRKALTVKGVEFMPELIQNGNSTITGGYEATEALLEVKGLDAIISLAPPMTIGCQKCLKRYKRKIPGDIAVAGFGDTEWADIADPPVTTLRHPLFEMGQMAAQKLLNRLEQPEQKEYETIRVPLELIRRVSF